MIILSSSGLYALSLRNLLTSYLQRRSFHNQINKFFIVPRIAFIMQAHQHWIKAHYNSLIISYGGKWVIVEKDKVVFTDASFDIVVTSIRK